MLFKRLVCGIILLAFGLTGVIPPSAYSQNIPNTPANILSLTPAFHPVMIQGMRVHPENPLRFDFIVDTGDGFVDVNGTQFKEETKKLIKYFLASLTVPEDQMWVNLSPYEKNRIIADGLGTTELGADMLSEDFILKQLTSSLIYPDSRTGRSFWKKVYTEAQENFGRTDIPVNTFNKVWIVPDKAVVYEHGNTVYVAESHLKVMLEEDYLALKKYQRQPGSLSPENIVIPAKAGTRNKNAINALGSQIVREIVLPELDNYCKTHIHSKRPRINVVGDSLEFCSAGDTEELQVILNILNNDVAQTNIEYKKISQQIQQQKDSTKKHQDTTLQQIKINLEKLKY